MTLEVHTDDLEAAGAALRRLGERVAAYGDRLDGRMTTVARGLDDELAGSLQSAWHDVAHAIDELAAGFRTYGQALDLVATRYADVESELTARAQR
jgi:uncharacterized protein YukE